MIGERIAILRRSKTSVDEMGDPIFSWQSETVANCVVRPLAGTLEAEQIRPEGMRVEYSIALPKTYTATMRPLTHAKVALIDRSMSTNPHKAFDVVGSPDVVRPCPTHWDVLVIVGRSDG